MRFFKKLPIRFKLFFTYALVSVVIFSISFTLLYFHVRKNLETRITAELTKSNQTITNLVETAATVSIKNYLRAIAEKNHEMVEHLYQESQQNLIPESEAKQQAVRVLLNQRIGKTGYIYCVNSSGVVLVHPKADVLGQDLSGLDFIQKQIKDKEGFLEYIWKNPGDVSERAKVLQMTYFKPWDWIISVSSYRSEFSELISIEDFKERILSLTYEKTGYSFVFDTKGNVLIHPELSGNILGMTDAEGTPIIREMIQRKKGVMTYDWKNPSEGKSRKKIVAFGFIPDFNWIIASSVYIEDVFLPLTEMRTLFLVILILSVVITAAVTLAVSASITKPLTELISRLGTGIQEDWSPVRLDETREDEIGRLSMGFNHFMNRLDVYRKHLVAENNTRKKAETRLRLFEKVFENANEGISITDEHGNIEAVNQAFTDITGYEPGEVIGKNPRILKSDRHNDEFYTDMWQSLIKKGYWAGEIWNRRKTGEAYPEFLSISAIREDTGPVKNYVAIFHDISEMKTKEKQIEHLAYHDPLTGLPNRTLLKDRLVQAIAKAGRTREMVQLLFIDLDNFKNVNDSVGHAKGDELLKEAAGRMLSITRVSDTVSRLGGDEFVIMVPHTKDMMEILGMVERLRAGFTEPFIVGSHTFYITCSIGISVFPNDGEDGETLIRHADMAMYQSKHEGKNRYHLFEQQMAKKIRHRLEMETNMRAALDNDEFQVYFQPQVNCRTLDMVGMEALARWIKPDGRIIPPTEFIPLAEETGLIVPIGEKIFSAAVIKAKQIRNRTGLDLSVSVNVSARQFDEKNFGSMVSGILAASDFPANRLKIEITESLLMKDIQVAMERLEHLSRIGVLTAIDDFGTGYSSLAYIKRLPISALKIDKSFIDDLPHDPENMALVETIVLMAHKLNIGIVAEGVENYHQLQALSQMGDMDIQGYVFARPMPFKELEAWIGDREDERSGQKKQEE